MFFNSVLAKRAAEILDLARKRGVKIVTAESCTGGLISALLTGIAGSSDVFERGFVTYSNEAKVEELGVESGLIEEFGAVSEEVAREMALGALKNSDAHLAVAVTGIAGPGGGSDEKPVGLVYVGVAFRGGVKVRKFCFSGDRGGVRLRAVEAVLGLIEGVLLG